MWRKLMSAELIYHRLRKRHRKQIPSSKGKGLLLIGQWTQVCSPLSSPPSSVLQLLIGQWTQILHPILPGVLDDDPFADSPSSTQTTQGGMGGSRESQGVVGVQGVLEVLGSTQTLLQECEVHPEVGSQLLAYLLYFINASLLNTLMERGPEAGFYQWSRGVRLRANLDVLLDWVHASGPPPGQLAPEHLHTLSAAVNLLATPRHVLLQTSWASLRADYPDLREAQLHHLLVHYSSASPTPQAWTPASPGPQTQTPASPGPQQAWTPVPGDLEAALRTADILESFDTQHPLVLPGEGYHLGAGAAVTDRALSQQLGRLQDFISRLSETPSNKETESTKPQERVVPAQARRVRMAVLPRPSLEVIEDSSPLSPPRDIELVITEEPLHTGEVEGEEREEREKAVWLSAPEEVHEEGSLVSEFLAALTSDRRSVIGALMEEEEEEEEEEEAEEEEEDLVFSLELERGERGLGLALVDARDPSLRTTGIFIRAVIPDSPAGRCEKLVPGDRILAVNGTSLLGLDLDLGKELIQASGNRPRLLVARSDWTSRGLHSKC
ncbi:unnamed protein product [Arctogadus glacialis]